MHVQTSRVKMERRAMCSYFVGVTIIGTLVVLVVHAHFYSSNSVTFLHTRTKFPSVTCTSLQSWCYNDSVDLRIMVLTYKRPKSLTKLLRSLDVLELDGDSASLEIWIDRNGKNGKANQRTVKVASQFHWSRGPSHVHVHRYHVGIYGQWIDTWRPPDDSDNELGLFCEDDLVISKYAYRWTRAVFRFYGNRTDFAGATLTSNGQKILSMRRKGQLKGPKTDTVVMYRYFGAWGFAPKPLHWRRFQTWFLLHKPSAAPHFHPYVPGTILTAWYKIFEHSGRARSMWSMWFVYYMYIEQLYSVYSNLDVYNGHRNSCLSINRYEPGLHYHSKGPENECRLLSVWKNDFVEFPKNIIRIEWNGSPVAKHPR